MLTQSLRPELFPEGLIVGRGHQESPPRLRCTLLANCGPLRFKACVRMTNERRSPANAGGHRSRPRDAAERAQCRRRGERPRRGTDGETRVAGVRRVERQVRQRSTLRGGLEVLSDDPRVAPCDAQQRDRRAFARGGSSSLGQSGRSCFRGSRLPNSTEGCATACGRFQTSTFCTKTSKKQPVASKSAEDAGFRVRTQTS